MFYGMEDLSWIKAYAFEKERILKKKKAQVNVVQSLVIFINFNVQLIN